MHDRTVPSVLTKVIYKQIIWLTDYKVSCCLTNQVLTNWLLPGCITIFSTNDKTTTHVNLLWVSGLLLGTTRERNLCFRLTPNDSIWLCMTPYLKDLLNVLEMLLWFPKHRLGAVRYQLCLFEQLAEISLRLHKLLVDVVIKLTFLLLQPTSQTGSHSWLS